LPLLAWVVAHCKHGCPPIRRPPVLAPAAAGSIPPKAYTTSGGVQITFNGGPASQAAAESSCRAQGGHLAWYGGQAEQAEVEQFYQAEGFLLPGHQHYWIGLRRNNGSNETWWLHDPLAARPGPGVYQNWGIYMPGSTQVKLAMP
jgi:hypothetical protein